MPRLPTRSDAAIGPDLVQLRELDMPTTGQTKKKDPPLDELVDRLTELMKQLPSSDLPKSMSRLPAPTGDDTDDNAQRPIDRPAERELLENVMQTLQRVEAAQAHAVADLRREIAQTFGQLILVLERPGELSDSSIQKLQVALGVAAHESTERRILAEVAEIRASLQRQAEEPIQKQKGGGHLHLIVAFGLAIILLVGGVVAGTLEAALVGSWLQRLLGSAF